MRFERVSMCGFWCCIVWIGLICGKLGWLTLRAVADRCPQPRQLVDTLGSAGTMMTAGDHTAAAAAGSKAAAAQALPALDGLASWAGRALEWVAHLHVPAGAELGALVPSGARTATCRLAALLLAVPFCLPSFALAV